MNRIADRIQPSLRKGIAYDTVLVAISQAFARGSLIFSGITVSHFLGQAAFADYSFLQMTASLVTTVASMGIGVLASRAAATGALDSNGPYAGHVNMLFMLTAITSTLAILATLTLPNTWLHVTGWSARLALAVMVWSGIVGGVLLGLINGLGRFNTLAWSSAANSVVTLSGAGLGAIMDSPIVAIVGMALGQFITVFLTAAVLRHNFALHRLRFENFNAAFIALRELFRLAIPVVLTSLVWTFAIWWSGKYLLLQPEGKREFALYAIGLQWFSAVLFIPGALNSALLPKLFAMSSSKILATSEKLEALALRGAAAAVAVAVPIAGMVLVLDGLGILSFAYQIEGSGLTKVLWPFLLAAVLASSVTVFGNAVIAQSGQTRWLFGMIGWAVILFAVPILGDFSASAVTTGLGLFVAYTALALYGFLMQTHKKIGCRIKKISMLID